MHYSETPEVAAEYLRLIIPQLSKLGLPADPMHYALWYEYVAGANEPLRKAIDVLLANKEKIDVAQTREIFRRYMGLNEADVVDQVRDQVRRIFAEMMQHIVEAGGDIRAYGKVVKEYSGQLESETDAEAIKQAIKGLSKETQKVSDSGSQMEQILMASNKELDLLRENLEEVRREGEIDPLTGTASRKGIERFATQLAETSTADDEPFCILYVDIDQFEKFNMGYGRVIGDRIIRFVAKSVADCVKGKDKIGRYEGEEFVVVLPKTPLFGALSLAENVRSELATKPLRIKGTGEDIGHATVSIGISVHRPGELVTETIFRANQAMHKAKSEGRNSVSSEKNL